MRIPDWHLVKRAVRFWWQRRTRGWDDSETWSLEHSLAKVIAPRLKRFKELNCGYPSNMIPINRCEKPTKKDCERAEKKWDAILDDMIYAFEFVGSDQYFEAPHDAPEWKRVERGLDLFRKYFHNLWH